MVDFKGQEAIIDRCNIGGGLQNDYIAGTVFVFRQEGLGTFTFDHATVPEDVVDDGLGCVFQISIGSKYRTAIEDNVIICQFRTGVIRQLGGGG